MSDPLTRERIEELRRIAEAATPGPWVADFGGTKGHIKAVLSGMSGTPTIAVYSDHVLEHVVPDDQREANGRYFETFDPITVLAMLDEIERLRGDVREWMCDHCNVVYPGPPADGVRCVVCSRCGGDTAPRTVVERRRLQRELDRSSAENARLISDIQSITAPVEVGGGADAYLRAEVDRLRREWEVLAAAIRTEEALFAAINSGDPDADYAGLLQSSREARQEALTLLDGQQAAAHTTTYRQMDEFADGWECTAPDCTTAWSLPNGGPSHHRMRFCPGCGRRIVGEEPWRVDEDGGTS